MKRFLTMILAALMLFTLVVPAAAAELKAFQDVNNSSWYAPSVYALVQKGIISGKSATTFDPQGNLTRAELMKMLACSVKTSAELAEYAAVKSFSDVIRQLVCGLCELGGCKRDHQRLQRRHLRTQPGGDPGRGRLSAGAVRPKDRGLRSGACEGKDRLHR